MKCNQYIFKESIITMMKILSTILSICFDLPKHPYKIIRRR
nr:MAG TPA_asm: hypothetical protein [Bacteriophage sp.]